MAEQRRQTPEAAIEAAIAELLASPAGAAGGAAGRAAWEWWWAGRLAALHGFPVRHCPHRAPGEPRRRWLAGFAAGTGAAARRAAPPA